MENMDFADDEYDGAIDGPECQIQFLVCSTVFPGGDQCPVCGSDDLEFHED